MKKITVVIMVITLIMSLAGCGKVNELTDQVGSVDDLKQTVEDLATDLVEEADKIKDVVENQTGDLVSSIGSKDAIVLNKNLKDRALLESIEYQYEDMAIKGYEITALNYYGYDGTETDTTIIFYDEQVMYRYSDETGTNHYSLFLADGTGYIWDDASNTGYLYPADMYDDDDDEDYDDYDDYDFDAIDFSQFYDTVIEAYVTMHNGFECLYMVLDDYGSETHIWMDLKTGMDIKTEYYYNGNLESRYEVITLKVLDREPGGVFTPPSDVTFEAFSWDIDMDFDMDYDMDDFDMGAFDMDALLQILEDAGIEVEPGMSFEEILELMDDMDY